jgi:hypothetical protein
MRIHKSGKMDLLIIFFVNVHKRKIRINGIGFILMVQWIQHGLKI